MRTREETIAGLILWKSKAKALAEELTSLLIDVDSLLHGESPQRPPVGLEEPISQYRCPICDADMKRRVSYRGAFFGCTRFPSCKGTRNADGSPTKPVVQTKTTTKVEPRDIDPDLYFDKDFPG